MAFFKKRKDRVVDLGERMRKQQEKAEHIRSEMQNTVQDNLSSDSSIPGAPSSSSQESGGNFLNFFSGIGQDNKKEETSSGYADFSQPSSTPDPVESRSGKLSKRLSNLTSQIEDLSNQLYKIEQRLELIERKMGLGY